MRRLIISELVTLDGVMEAPGGEPSHPHTGWAGQYMTAEEEQLKFQEVLEVDTLLLGRVTYESFAGAWPTYQGEFADRMNSMEKVVVSNTLRAPEWTNTKVLAGDPIDAALELKQGDGGPIMVQGSATLVHDLLDTDLVDELRMLVFPVSIGGGTRVFPDTLKRIAWERNRSQELASGARYDIYVPS